MNIDEQIIAVWDEMGLTDEERINELRPLNEKIDRIKKEKIDETIREMQQLQLGIDETKQKHIRMLQVTGASPFEIEEVQKNGIHGSLKERFDQVQDAYEEYKPRYVETVQKLQKMVDILQELFEILEIPEQDRGDFAAVGETDLTAKRLQAFSNKIDRLQNEINANDKYAQQFIIEIQKLSTDLGVEIKNEIRSIIDRPPYRPSDLVKLKQERDLLQNEFTTNSNYISELALQIKRLWDILEVSEEERQDFLDMHNGVSYNQIAACVKLINTLNKQRNQMVPQLITESKEKISELCKKMRYTKDQESAIFNRVETKMESQYPSEKKPENENSQIEKSENELQQSETQKENEQTNESYQEIRENEEESKVELKDEKQTAEGTENSEENQQITDDNKQNAEEEEKKEITTNEQQNNEEEDQQIEEPQQNVDSEQKSEEIQQNIENEEKIDENIPVQEKVEIEEPVNIEEEEEEDINEVFQIEDYIDEEKSAQTRHFTPRKTFVDADDLLTSENSAMNTPQKQRQVQPTELKPIENTQQEEREIAYFELLDAEYMHLQRLYEMSKPIHELIQQRESIIKEKFEIAEEKIEKPKPVRMSLNPKQTVETEQPVLEKVAEKKARQSYQPKSARPLTEEKNARRSLAPKTARKHMPGEVSPEKFRMRPPDPSKSLKAEKAERRYKVVLPRVEKKLALALFEYKKESGEDFTLDGEIYANKLPNFQLSQTEKRMAKTSLSGKGLKH